MLPRSVDHLILEGAKSPELAATFEAIADIAIGGMPKYLPMTCHELQRAIVCRCYTRPVLELCHLLVIADACGGRGRFEPFFAEVAPARAGAYRGYIERSLRSAKPGRVKLTRAATTVEIDYADGRFAVSYARMPFLVALMEFMAGSVGYCAVEEVIRPVLADRPTLQAIGTSANALSKLLYDYLKDHLPSAQLHRKFERLIDHLEGRLGARFEPGSVDDESVLAFWQQESIKDGGEGADFRTYASVFRGFLRLIQALNQAQRLYELKHPRVIGTDREAGEIDPSDESVLALLEDLPVNPLEALDRPPVDGVKFLNKREKAAIELLAECGDGAIRLPLSLLRCEVFGKGQARITRALRCKAGAAELRQLIDESAPEDYPSRRQAYSHLDRHIERVLLASLYLLARARRPEAFTVIMGVKPDLDLKRLAEVIPVDPDLDGEVVYLDQGAVADRVFAVLEDEARVGPDLARLMTDSRKAFRGLARQGFADSAEPVPDLVEAHARGVEALMTLDRLLRSYLRELGRLGAGDGEWRRRFDADRAVFSRQFDLIYGAAR